MRKNNLGNEGIKYLSRGIAMNNTLVHIDLGSNAIGPDGYKFIFNTLKNHPSITSVSFANVDGVHRNR